MRNASAAPGLVTATGQVVVDMDDMFVHDI